MTETVIEEAARIIDGKRTEDYGKAEDSFKAIADAWEWYSQNCADDGPLNSLDVAYMMILLKLARLTTGQPKRDSYVDLIGYAALAARIAGVDGQPDPDKWAVTDLGAQP